MTPRGNPGLGSEDEEPDMQVSVRKPMRMEGDSESLVTYEIVVQDDTGVFSLPRSVVRRRYSDFVRLRRLLKQHHPSRDVPCLPAKTYFRTVDDSFIEARNEGLNTFLKELTAESVFLSDSALHLYLQTTLGTKDIERTLVNKKLSAADAVVSEENVAQVVIESNDHKMLPSEYDEDEGIVTDKSRPIFSSSLSATSFLASSSTSSTPSSEGLSQPSTPLSSSPSSFSGPSPSASFAGSAPPGNTRATIRAATPDRMTHVVDTSEPSFVSFLSVTEIEPFLSQYQSVSREVPCTAAMGVTGPVLLRQSSGVERSDIQ